MNSFEDREIIRVALEKEDIEARTLWKPMHLQPIFKKYPSYINGVSDNLFKKGLCLPSGSNLNDEDRSDRVIADKWDTAYTLHIGQINKKELQRLETNVPLQESGRNSANQLVLSRANKSVRLFNKVVE